MTTITAKYGTIKHMAANGTLTFDGIPQRGWSRFSDLGLSKLWEAYQNRLAFLDYWYGQYVEYLDERLSVKEDIVHPFSGEVIFEVGDILSRDDRERLMSCLNCIASTH